MLDVRDAVPSLSPPAGILEMVRRLWPDDVAQREALVSVAVAVQSFLAARRLQSWGDLDVDAFVASQARRPRAAIQVCLDLSGMLPWMVRSGELSRADATVLWLSLREACPDDADARASIEMTMELLGDRGVRLSRTG